MTNSIHPTAIITGEVVLGVGNTIGPFAVITGPVTIGDHNWVGTGVVIGAPPEVRGFDHSIQAGEPAGNGVVIGSRNVLREYCQVHQGWQRQTLVGDDLFIMNQAYVAHDCTLGNGVTLASSVLLAGHVVIEEGANLGLGAAVHQHRRVGSGSIVGMGSIVTRDIPPFAKAFGNPAEVRGANRVGMERWGIPVSSIDAVERTYQQPEDRWVLKRLSTFEGLETAFRRWQATR